MKKEILIPFGLVGLIAGFTYGVLLPFLGFYADDWYVLWGAITNGTQTIIDLHLIDRPLMGFIYSLVYSVLGTNPFAWHLYALFLRIMGSFVFLWILRMLFPNKSLETTSAALLMVVYPGLLRQTTAMTFSNQFFAFLAALFSIAFSLRAVLTSHRKEWLFFTFLGLLFSFVYLFYIEYLVGLEGLRFLVLWVANQPKNQPILSRIRNTVYRYFPYAIPVAAMIVWRLFFFEAGRKGMDVDVVFSSFDISNLLSFVRIGVELFRDFFETAFIAWFFDPYVLSTGALYRDLLPSFIVVGVVLFVYWAGGRFLQSNTQEEDQAARTLLGVGLLSMLIGFLPVLAVGREVVLDTWQNGYNKYTLHVTASVGMFLVGLLMHLKNRKALMLSVSILLGFAVFSQYHNAVRFKNQWEIQKDIWWQVAWRVPDFVDQTVLMSRLPVEPSYIEAHEIWGPANIIYRPDIYDVLIPGEIVDVVTKDKVFFGASDQKSVRGLFPMTRDYDKVLLFAKPTQNSCVHFYDRHKLELSRTEDPLIQLLAPYSSIEGIQTGDANARVPVEIFGQEPDHMWCYYYQKATLARQQGDWETVASLGNQAEKNGYKPLDLTEWFPFYEAYVQLGNLEKAKHLATLIRSDRLIRYEYCKSLETTSGIPGFDQTSVYTFLCEK